MIVRNVAVVLVVEVERPSRYVAAATLREKEFEVLEATPLMRQPICFSRILTSASCRRLSQCSPAVDPSKRAAAHGLQEFARSRAVNAAAAGVVCLSRHYATGRSRRWR